MNLSTETCRMLITYLVTKRAILTVIFSVLCLAKLAAQERNLSKQELTWYESDYYYLLQSDTLAPSRIRLLPDSLWSKSDNISESLGEKFWVKIYLPDLTEDSYHLNIGNSAKNVFLLQDGKIRELQSNAVLTADSWDRWGQRYYRISKETLKKENALLLLLHMHPYSKTPGKISISNNLRYSLTTRYLRTDSLFWDGFVTICFAGAMMMVLLYTLCITFYDRKKLYLYYVLYIIAITIYLVFRSGLTSGRILPLLEQHIFGVSWYISITFQYIAHYFILQFSLQFLNAKTDYPRFYKAGRFVSHIFMAAVVISFINLTWVHYYPLTFWLSNIERGIAAASAFYFQAIILLERKNRLAVFYAVGSFVFVTGALLALFLENLLYMKLGTILEVLLFSLGLAYRFRLIQEERNSFREQMLDEVSRNEKILQQYNEDLKEQVTARSEALLKEQQQVENEKKKVLQLRLERERDTRKMVALRTQMKPHFLFNALNAIRSFIIKEDPDQAYDYLTDFSRLIRYILESSEYAYVSIREELEMLKTYVNIERMR
ncbi:MAG: histidine kinase, partial [Cyclobacteriaceae bacterium]